MKHRFGMSIKIGTLLLAIVVLAPVSTGLSRAAESDDIGKIIRARIEIGSWMREYMKEIRYEEKSMEDLGKMEQEINSKVAEILDSHGMTLEDYEKKSVEVLSDKEGVQAFFESHPEIQKEYDQLPMHGMRGGPPPSGTPPGHP